MDFDYFGHSYYRIHKRRTGFAPDSVVCTFSGWFIWSVLFMNKNLLTQKILMLETLVIKIHELIHQNRVEEAEEILHKIILGDESGVNPKLYIANDAANKVSQFDFEFRKLCEKHKMISAYVAEIAQEQADGMIRISWHSGGIGWMSKIIDSFSEKFSSHYRERLGK